MKTKSHFWLQPDYRVDGSPPKSRTQALQHRQRSNSHEPCFGSPENKHLSRASPDSCGETECPFRRECLGLNEKIFLNPDRLREESIESLSRIYLISRLMEQARAGERRLNSLSPFQQRVADLVNSWQGDVPQIAFVGSFSSGKSTLLNALVDSPLLPTNLPPTTAVPTTIKFGETSSAVITFRRSLRQGIVGETLAVDANAVRGLYGLLSSADDRQIRRVSMIRDGKRRNVSVKTALAELRPIKKSLDEEQQKRHAGASTRFKMRGRKRQKIEDRTFSIEFEEQPPLELDLRKEKDRAKLKSALAHPAMSMATEHAECVIPHPLLKSLALIDTAGLCSPAGFHETVTARLLKRSPDKIVVVLRATHIDHPTTREAIGKALQVVGKQNPTKRIVFALTHWDTRLSKSRMMEDRDLTRAPSEAEFERIESGARRRAKRILSRVLNDDFGWPSGTSPRCYFLGLSVSRDDWRNRDLERLTKDLEADSKGAIGISLWRNRWREQAGLLNGLRDEHDEVVEGLEEAIQELKGDTQSDDLKRLKEKKSTISAAVKRFCKSLRQTFRARKKLMATEISGLHSQSSIKTYVKKGYWNAANEFLNALQEESAAAAEELGGIVNPKRPQIITRSLRPISLDRTLLGLSKDEQKAAQGKVTGFRYGMGALWDFLFGSIPKLEVNESRRAAAREIFHRQLENTCELIEEALEEWVSTAQEIEKEQCRRIDDRLEWLDSKGAKRLEIADKFRRRLGFVESLEKDVSELNTNIDQLRAGLEVRSGEVVEGTVSHITNFGVFVDIGGMDALLHISEIIFGRLDHPTQRLEQGEQIKVVVKDIEPESGKVSLSRKPLFKSEWKQLIAQHSVGDVIEGEVLCTAPRGIYVELTPNILGLVHKSEIAWGDEARPEDLHEVGDSVQAVIIELDPENFECRLSIKQLSPSPFEEFVEQHPVGTTVTGEVNHITDYGAFLSIGEVDGLLHISEMIFGYIHHPSKRLDQGDKIDVVVRDIDVKSQDISFSRKLLLESEWQEFQSEYSVGDIVEKEVFSIGSSGLIIELTPNIAGLVHKSEIVWGKRVSPKNAYEVGDSVQAVITDIDTQNFECRLSIKRMSTSPFEKFMEQHSVGTVVWGEVTNIVDFGAFVKLTEDLDGLAHISELADEQIEDPNDVVSCGDELRFRIESIDSEQHRISLSLRKMDAQ